MENNRSSEKTSRLINWVTVWGFIFGCIAFNLYFDNRQIRLNGNWYRDQYEAESQRADSLHRAAIQLEQRLQKIESTTGQKLSASQPDIPRKSPITSEL